MDKLTENALSYVREYFKNDSSGHDYYHTLRVYELAKKIAEKENADVGLTCIIALLHDVDDCKLVGESGLLFENTRHFLQENNVDAETIELICSEISKISFKGSGANVPETLEGKIAQDADRLDCLGAIGIARTFAYGGSTGRAIYSPETEIRDSLSASDYYSSSGTSINHFYEKILKLLDLINTDEARKIAAKRNDFIIKYLDEFFAEWNGEK